MARFVLTQVGGSRGFGKNNSARVNINNMGNVVIQWADGTSANTIDGIANDDND